MQALSQNRQTAIILVGLLFGQLLLMTGSAKGSDGASLLESWSMRVSAPFVVGAQAVGGWVRGTFTGLRALLAVRARNATLESEVAGLRTELQRSREALVENERLRQLLGMREELAPRSIGASVMTSTLTEQTKMIVVDRGAKDGVRNELPVVAWGGAVGRVVAVDRSHAKIRLLTDPNSGVGAMIQRSRAQGMVVGRGSEPLDLLYVPRFSDVVHGDRVVTSGMDGIFHRGFGIGTVRAIEQAPDGSQTIQLEPELDYRSLEEVVIQLERAAGETLPTEAQEEAR